MADWTEKGITVVRGRINASSRIPAANKRAIDGHLSFLRARDANPKTVYKHLFALEKFLAALGKKDVNKVTRSDMEFAIGNINALGLGVETKRNIRTIVKQFYKHLLGEDMYYPKQVAWIKTSGKKKDKMLPENLITEDEVLKLLIATKNIRDKAIIALLFDSGIRAGELLNMKKRDVDVTTEPAHIVVNGKTGMRKIPLMFSVPYLSQYINSMNQSTNDPLWPDIGLMSEKNIPLKQSALGMMLKKVAKRAKIDKRIYAHLFRHSRASNYANSLTEQQLKMFFGWTGDSNMASVYVHLSGRDIDNAVLKANGMQQQEVNTQPKLTIKTCGRCQFTNTIEATYCNRCGTAMDITTAMNIQQAEDNLKKSASVSYHDPKLVEEIVHEYLMRERERMKKSSVK